MAVSDQKKWSEQSQRRLKNLIHKAIDCIIVSQEANTASYKKRNCYMVDYTDYILGVFDDEKRICSGTAQIVNYGHQQGRQITLIYPDTADVTYLV